MTVSDLIKELQTLDPNLKIHRPGYEAGFKEVSEVVVASLATQVHTEWYYGEHEIVGKVPKEDLPKYAVIQGVIIQ